MPAVRPLFVLFGDSITQRGFAPGGWAAALADRYTRRADVVNRGYSGYNSQLATHLLPHVFQQGSEAPALVTLFLGANDAALPQRMSARQHVPLAAYAANLRAIAAHLRATWPARPPTLVLITPPPVDEAARITFGAQRWGDAFDGQAERDNATAGQYAAACRQVAAELGVPCVDAWTRFQADPAWRSTHLDDGLHLAPAGNAALFEALSETIETQLPALAPAALPFDFPEWFDVDAADPAKSFAR